MFQNNMNYYYYYLVSYVLVYTQFSNYFYILLGVNNYICQKIIIAFKICAFIIYTCHRKEK